MDETRESIEWQTILKASTEAATSVPWRTEGSVKDLVDNILYVTDVIYQYRQAMTPQNKTVSPADASIDVPYGEEPPQKAYGGPPPHPGPSSGPPAAYQCKCGEIQVFNSGTGADGKDWSGYFCPAQEKSRDPAEQAKQKVLHPPTWL